MSANAKRLLVGAGAAAVVAACHYLLDAKIGPESAAALIGAVLVALHIDAPATTPPKA